ncbi:hypothetical protein CRENBAI_013604 [Crenichthys baileyi]|uniref:Uncharacterized protein n=1 Tax=Crenichthys baileyi TaxID=28760 RepID=A0AAV9RYC0_9TELE
MGRLCKAMLQHLNQIQVQTLTRPLPNLHYVFKLFWIIVLLHYPGMLGNIAAKEQNSWPYQSSKSGLEARKQPQTITLSPSAQCNGVYTLEEVSLLSHQSTKYFPKSPWDLQNCLNGRQTLVLSLVSSGLTLELFPFMLFLPSLSFTVQS